MEDAQIRQHIEAVAEAIRKKDLAALMPLYAADVATYDLMPLQLRGADAYRKNFQAWFASVQGPIDYEIHDLHVAASGDLAICHHVARVRSARKTGEKNDYWVRVTASLRKAGGRWAIAHEHISLPFKSP